MDGDDDGESMKRRESIRKSIDKMINGSAAILMLTGVKQITLISP